MRYDTGALIGRGASAEVFRAWDPVEERPVAIKLFPSGDAEATARREREARAQASLDHPSICTIYEIGTTSGGRPFFAMRYVDGEPLDAVCARLPIRRRVELVTQVADAVAVAHRAGLVHRDLKPSNILVEEQADDSLRPFVLDFGIVHEIEATRLTETGEILGTPGYFSPEQARGAVTVDARSDVFSLGVVLYQVLTGELPFAGTSSVGSILQVLDHDPPLAHTMAAEVPSELGHIVQKAIEKDPRRRYADAGALARDLRRSLDGGQTTAKGVGPLGRWWRRAERHPRLWATGLIATLLILAALGWGLVERWQADRIARDAEAFSRRATEIVARARYTELLPRHPIVDERRRLLDEVSRLADDVERASGRAAAAGAYAVGRAERALGRPARALDAFERAGAAGIDDEAWRLDLSLALLDTTRGRLREVEQLTDADARQAFRDRLLDQLRDRRDAAEGRARSTGDAGESRLRQGDRFVIEALDAYLDGRTEDTRQAAEAARDLEPWRFEADLLLADLHRDAASVALLADDQERANVELDAERAVLDAAIERAPSSPALYRRLAENHLTQALTTVGHGGDPAIWQAAFAGADQAITLAVDVLPDDLAARSLGIEVSWRRSLAQLRARGADGLATTTERTVADARALATHPEAGATEWRNLGNAIYARASVLRESGDVRPALYEEAAEALGRALDAAPGIAASWQSLGIAWSRHGLTLAATGGDPRPSYRRAIDAFERSLSGVESHESRVRSNICTTWAEIAYYGMSHRDETSAEAIGQALDAGDAACRRAIELAPEYLTARSNRALLEATVFEHLVAEDRDAQASLDRGLDAFESLFALDPQHVSGRINYAGFVSAVTAWRLDRDASTTPSERAEWLADIDSARQRTETLRDLAPIDAAINLVRLETLAGAIACRGEPATHAQAFEAAAGWLERLEATDAWRALRAELRAELDRRRGECTARPESGIAPVPDLGPTR